MHKKEQLHSCRCSPSHATSTLAGTATIFIAQWSFFHRWCLPIHYESFLRVMALTLNKNMSISVKVKSWERITQEVDMLAISGFPRDERNWTWIYKWGSAYWSRRWTFWWSLRSDITSIQWNPFTSNTSIMNYAFNRTSRKSPLKQHVYTALSLYKLIPKYYGIYRAFLLPTTAFLCHWATNFALTEYKRAKKRVVLLNLGEMNFAQVYKPNRNDN